MADVKSEVERFGEGLKRVWRRITGAKQTTYASDASRSAENELLNTLFNMERDYKAATAVPEPDYEALIAPSLNLTKRQFDYKSEDELRKTAESEKAPSLAENINSTNETADKNLAEINETLRRVQQEHAGDTLGIETQYEDAAARLQRKMINNGLTESSIRTSLEDELQGDMLASLKSLRADYEAKAESLKGQISIVETERQNALSEYRIKYAAEVEKRISALKSELRRELELVNQYNAKIVRDEYEYQATRQKKIDDMRVEHQKTQQEIDAAERENENLYGYTGEKAVEMNRRYKEALAFYGSLGRNEANELLENSRDSLKSVLGRYYSQLVAAINA